MDEIKITDLEIYGHHGVLKEENVLGQKFLVSLVLRLNTSKAGKSDDIADSIDYSAIAGVVREVVENTKYNLIEAVAENIAGRVLREFDIINDLTIEVKKPWAPISIPLETVSVKISRGWHDAYLSLGANIGDREGNISSALELLSEDKNIRLIKTADIIETKPYGVTDQPDFLNTCAYIKTLYDPRELLEVIQQTEKEKSDQNTDSFNPLDYQISITHIDYDPE